jgi:ATP-binding cassette subfamily F protein 3
LWDDRLLQQKLLDMIQPLIGENGCGKSTLLKMIAGVETPTDGVVTRPGNSSVGYLAQQMQYGEGNTVYQELLGVFDEVRNMGRKLADLEADMSDPTASADPVRLQRTMDRYGELAAEFERLGGYAFEHRIDAVMEGLRISHLRDQPVHTLSGGEKNITALARILLQEPQILLLDEPTNHLDIASREQVEEALEEFEGTLLVISHDRYFLDRVVDRIVEVVNPGLKDYPGSFSYFWEEKRKAGQEKMGPER